jgi:hypothetical protein
MIAPQFIPLIPRQTDPLCGLRRGGTGDWAANRRPRPATENLISRDYLFSRGAVFFAQDDRTFARHRPMGAAPFDKGQLRDAIFTMVDRGFNALSCLTFSRSIAKTTKN